MDCHKINFHAVDLTKQNQHDIPLYWSSMYNSQMWFIDHELSKHGSCWEPKRANLSKVEPELAYVQQNGNLDSPNGILNTFLQLSMAISKKNDIYEILKSFGILPSNNETVEITNIISAIENYFGFDGFVYPVCQAKNHRKYFSEIRFCLDDNYRKIKCEGKTVQNHINSCAKGVLYPEFPQL